MKVKAGQFRAPAAAAAVALFKAVVWNTQYDPIWPRWSHFHLAVVIWFAPFARNQDQFYYSIRLQINGSRNRVSRSFHSTDHAPWLIDRSAAELPNRTYRQPITITLTIVNGRRLIALFGKSPGIYMLICRNFTTRSRVALVSHPTGWLFSPIHNHSTHWPSTTTGITRRRALVMFYGAPCGWVTRKVSGFSGN